MLVPDQDDHLRELEAELDELRRALIELRKQPLRPDPAFRSGALEAANRRLNSLKTLARLLRVDASDSRTQLERAQRDAWDQKARRADATARLKGRERLLEQIQRSAPWKIVKPIWKLFNRTRKGDSGLKNAGKDLAFAFDLPKRWKTSRDVILIKGWCFSRSGRPIAGVRAKIGSKARLARYGMKRLDVAGSFPEYPEAEHCGFTVELKVPAGVSTVRLEVIEQGSDWQPFLEQSWREKREKASRETEPADDGLDPGEPTERILKTPFPLRGQSLRACSSRRCSNTLSAPQQATPLFSVLTPTFNSKPEWLAEAALSLVNQTFADWEWCIIDDGSDNRETKKLLESLAGQPARPRAVRLKWRHQRRLQPGARSRPRRVCLLSRSRRLAPSLRARGDARQYGGRLRRRLYRRGQTRRRDRRAGGALFQAGLVTRIFSRSHVCRSPALCPARARPQDSLRFNVRWRAGF